MEIYEIDTIGSVQSVWDLSVELVDLILPNSSVVIPCTVVGSINTPRVSDSKQLGCFSAIKVVYDVSTKKSVSMALSKTILLSQLVVSGTWSGGPDNIVILVGSGDSGPDI